MEKIAKTATTLVRLPEDRMYELRARASREGKSLAGLVREAVDVYLGREPPNPAPPSQDPFDGIVGAFNSGVPDAAVNHDHYLYGWPKEEAEAKKEAKPAPVRRLKRPHRPRRSE